MFSREHQAGVEGAGNDVHAGVRVVHVYSRRVMVRSGQVTSLIDTSGAACVFWHLAPGTWRLSWHGDSLNPILSLSLSLSHNILFRLPLKCNAT